MRPYRISSWPRRPPRSPKLVRPGGLRRRVHCLYLDPQAVPREQAPHLLQHPVVRLHQHRRGAGDLRVFQLAHRNQAAAWPGQLLGGEDALLVDDQVQHHVDLLDERHEVLPPVVHRLVGPSEQRVSSQPTALVASTYAKCR